MFLNWEYNPPMTTSSPQATFYGLGIAPIILDMLERQRFKVPTPIQQRAIPVALEGKDVLGIAQTGTGKTLAFGIPIIQRLAQFGGRALVLVPTRELALQVDETLQKIAQPFHLRTAVMIGGASMDLQIQSLRRAARVLIATPGRLMDHLNRRSLDLKDVHGLVLDEADRMLDMGFAPQIEKIVRLVPKDRQTLLFSATMPSEILHIATAYMKLPLRIEIAPQGTVADKVVQELFIVKAESKRALLDKILKQYHGSVLLFTRTKAGARKVSRSVKDMRHTSAEIHSNRSLNQRREALEGFRSGKYRVLVATDIASRGIDVKGIELVINYDLPDDLENYIHRIGRTGRAGLEGRAITFATPDQGGDVKGIERLMRLTLPVSSHPEMPSERFLSYASPSRSRSGPRPHGGQRPYGGNRPHGNFGRRSHR
jgi:ATP-dependent RNA helicase RhlE